MRSGYKNDDNSLEDETANGSFELLDSQQAFPLDTCLQPTDCQGSDIFSIAPAERNGSLSILSDPDVEFLSFQTLFQCGRNGFSTDRVPKLHLCKTSENRSKVCNKNRLFCAVFG